MRATGLLHHSIYPHDFPKTHFDLYLQRRAASSTTAPWANVAVSKGGTSTEAVDYSAVTGYSYRWIVASAKGSGSFLLCTKGL
jgi:hypothetical protein